jgi:hypothetical protein
MVAATVTTWNPLILQSTDQDAQEAYYSGQK